MRNRLREYQLKHRNDTDSVSETDEERVQRETDCLNAIQGKLEGLNCTKCNNKGIVYVRDGLYIASEECSCMKIRREKQRIEQSGLAPLMSRYTFDNYETTEQWQQTIKTGAKQFIHEHDQKWFFIGGQPGLGKTHICTAIVSEFLKQGIESRYVIWKEEAGKLKNIILDDSYAVQMRKLQRVPVLYIDDFFKTAKDDSGQRRLPTPGDINVAFELLNYRYNNNCITIISSERTTGELLDCDEAVGSRIYERSKDYCFNFSPDRKKNYRLK